MDKQDRKSVDVSGFQVIVDRPVWLSSRIWEPRLYESPVPSILLEATRECSTQEDSVLHFARNGVVVNPFSSATMVDLEPAEIPDPEETPVEEEASEEVTPEESAAPAIAPTVFKPIDEFAGLSKSEQFEYVESIRNAPEGATEDEVTQYEADLYPVLKEYAKVATGTKAKDIIKEVLAEYN